MKKTDKVIFISSWLKDEIILSGIYRKKTQDHIIRYLLVERKIKLSDIFIIGMERDKVIWFLQGKKSDKLIWIYQMFSDIFFINKITL